MTEGPAFPFPIEELARAVAANIAALGGPQPIVTVRRPQAPAPDDGAAAAATDTGADVTIEIKYQSTTLGSMTYGLVVKTPTKQFTAWLFLLTFQKGSETPVDLARFEFTSKAEWHVTVRTPFEFAIPNTPVTFKKLEIDVYQRPIPDPPPQAAA